MSILVTCAACRRKLKVRDESLGKTIKCPSCEEKFVARAADNASDSPPPKSRREEQIRGGKPLPSRKARPTRGDEDEDDYDREPRRGRRSGREPAGSNKGLIIGLVAGGVLLLAGVVVGAVLLFGKKDKPADEGGSTKEVAGIKAAPGPVVQNPPVNPNPFVPPPRRNPLPSNFIIAHGLPTKYMVLNPAGTVLASADQQMLKLWDPFTKDHKHLATFSFLMDPVSALAFSADGKQLAVGRGGKVELRDGRTGKEMATVPLQFREEGVSRNGLSRCLAFAPNRTVLAVGMTLPGGGARHGNVYLWDTAASKEVRRFKAHDREVWAVAYSPDGSLLATAGGDNLVKLWDTTTWAERAVLRGHARDAHALAFTRDGLRLASAGSDATVIVWDVAAGKEKGRLAGHKGAVLGVAYSPDGKLLATGAADSTLRLWDAQTFAERWLLRHPGRARVEAVAFHPDGVNLFSTYSGMIQRWELPKLLGP